MTKGAGLGRRSFLSLTGAGAAATMAGLFPAPAIAAPAKTAQATRTLSLFNVNTGESGRFVYWENGSYDPGAVRRISHLLRDHRNDVVHPISNDLIDLMARLRQQLNSDGQFQIISAFRSQETNDDMVGKRRGVAKRSYHMDGKAVDLRLPGRGLHQVRGAALQLAGGGVGYYPSSNFIHLDVGPVRRW